MSNVVNKYMEGKDAELCYRKIGHKSNESMLGCGFIKKTSKDICTDLNLDFYSGVLLLTGSGWYSDQSGSYKMSTNHFIQRLPHVTHTTTVSDTEEWLEFFLCINTTTYNNLFNMGLLSSAPVLKGEIPASFIAYLPSFIEKMKVATDTELVGLFFEAQNILCQLTNYCSEENMKGNLIYEAVKLIETSYGRIKGSDLALELAVSYETLRNKFYEATGFSIGKFCILTRINQIKETLLNSDLSLTQIAVQFGYSDYFAFSKQFKAYTSMTPSVFRNTYQYQDK